jgi:hypothetical protein
VAGWFSVGILGALVGELGKLADVGGACSDEVATNAWGFGGSRHVGKMIFPLQDSQTGRQPDSQTARETERQMDRQTDRLYTGGGRCCVPEI